MGDGTLATASISQIVSLPANQDAVLEVYHDTGAVDSVLYAPIRVSVYNTDGDLVARAPLISVRSGGYTRSLADLGGFAGQTVRVALDGAPGSLVFSQFPFVDGYLDDIRLVGGSSAVYVPSGDEIHLDSVVYDPNQAGDKYVQPEGQFYRFAPDAQNHQYSPPVTIPYGDGDRTLSYYAYYQGAFEAGHSFPIRTDSGSPWAALLIAPPVEVYQPAGQKAVNGSFETGTTAGWMTSGTGSVITTDAHTGTHCYNLGPSPNNSVGQTVSLPPGSEPLLRFWTKGVLGSQAMLYIRSTSGVALLSTAISNSGAWLETAMSCAAFAGGTVTIEFRPKPRSSAVLIDDMSVEYGAGVAVEDPAHMMVLADDLDSGISETSYTIDGGPEHNSTSVVLSGAGEHTVSVTPEDIAGNSRDVQFHFTDFGQPISVPEAKTLPLGSFVTLQTQFAGRGVQVSEGNVLAYLLEPEPPHFGIQIRYNKSDIPWTVSTGSGVRVRGRTAISGQEMYVGVDTLDNLASVQQISSTNITCSDIAGLPLGNQPGASGSTTPNNVGMPVQITGHVVSTSGSIAYIDDGSGANAGQGVYVDLTGYSFSAGELWTVSGYSTLVQPQTPGGPVLQAVAAIEASRLD